MITFTIVLSVETEDMTDERLNTNLCYEVEWHVLPRVGETIDCGVELCEVDSIFHNILGHKSIEVCVCAPAYVYDNAKKEGWREKKLLIN